MKRIPFLHQAAGILLLCVTMALQSCHKDPLQPDSPSGTIDPTTVGKPLGQPYTEWIGTEGGLVKSPDGVVEIDFPQGALTEETEIGIVPLENTAPGGKGFGYRLTPHGGNFKKQVTIRFNYGKFSRTIGLSKTLEIAYQDDKGVWVCPGMNTNDTIQKVISVKTDHFSDWAIISKMELTPLVKTVGLAEQVKLTAVDYANIEDDWYVVPLTQPTKIGKAEKIANGYIVKWTLLGPGTLNPNGNEATYTAPSVKPAVSTATIVLELKVGTMKVLLFSTIHIIEDGISLSIDGGPWHSYSGMAARVLEEDGFNYYTISALRLSSDIPQIGIHWRRSGGQPVAGVFPWSMLGDNESDVTFQYAEPDLGHMYVSVYEIDPDTREQKDSGGFVSIEETVKDGKKYVEGIFVVDNAGYIKNAEDLPQLKVSSITGTFKVQHSW
ncbi:hypothetical protein ACFSQD_04510 [Flavihumibacter stibioxidans]|uniref:ZU5 domain-containing protein n=1 Tax=Flavihumibacter stibioxidans TaxID=1834163 RepID=A0ABR7M3I0_9BACT|nr:hypothetical protein [Flavihumibacter stibioxidans]MBC6489571.1 hypothetical protein [Flavihumibacter stibioxidans]